MFPFEIQVQRKLNHPKQMSERKVMAETLKQHRSEDRDPSRSTGRSTDMALFGRPTTARTVFLKGHFGGFIYGFLGFYTPDCAQNRGRNLCSVQTLEKEKKKKKKKGRRRRREEGEERGKKKKRERKKKKEKKEERKQNRNEVEEGIMQVI